MSAPTGPGLISFADLWLTEGLISSHARTPQTFDSNGILQFERERDILNLLDTPEAVIVREHASHPRNEEVRCL